MNGTLGAPGVAPSIDGHNLIEKYTARLLRQSQEAQSIKDKDRDKGVIFRSKKQLGPAKLIEKTDFGHSGAKHKLRLKSQAQTGHDPDKN